MVPNGSKSRVLRDNSSATDQHGQNQPTMTANMVKNQMLVVGLGKHDIRIWDSFNGWIGINNMASAAPTSSRPQHHQVDSRSWREAGMSAAQNKQLHSVNSTQAAIHVICYALQILDSKKFLMGSYSQGKIMCSTEALCAALVGPQQLSNIGCTGPASSMYSSTTLMSRLCTSNDIQLCFRTS